MSAPKRVGPYEIVAQIGLGGMAEVFLARDPRSEREVALKLLPRHFARDATFRTRFEREVRTIASLEHPAIVPIYDFGEHEGQPYIVMGRMRNGSLGQRLSRGALAGDDVLEIVERMGHALDAAHGQGLVHHDLKPANILFDRRNKSYLSDFGIVKMAGGGPLAEAGGIIGNADYMSPEQLRGEGGVDHRSDIYSLAATVYAALSGIPPYRAASAMGVLTRHLAAKVPLLHEEGVDVPPQVSAVVARGLAKNADDRFATAGDFARAFAAAWQSGGAQKIASWDEEKVGSAVAPAAVVAQRREEKGTARNPWYLLAGVLILVVGVAGGILLALNGSRRAGEAEDGERTPGTRAAVVVEVIEEATTGPALATLTATAAATALPFSPTPAAAGVVSLATAGPTTVAAPPVATTALQVGASMIAAADGMMQLYVPAGTFLMGSTPADTDAGADEMPQREIYLDAFWIDRTEVSIAQYRRCVQAGACPPPLQNDAVTYEDYYGNAMFDDYPVVWVPWAAADAYCRWAGRQLPSEAQWEKAARGTEGALFPWGNSRPSASTANTCDLMCPYGWADAGVDDGYAGPAPVEAFAAGISPNGALNMAGNVWEWTATFYDAAYYEAAPAENPTGPASGEEYLMRGGSWQDRAEFMRAAGRNRETQFPENLYNVGFRCVQPD